MSRENSEDEEKDKNSDVSRNLTGDGSEFFDTVLVNQLLTSVGFQVEGW